MAPPVRIVGRTHRACVIVPNARSAHPPRKGENVNPRRGSDSERERLRPRRLSLAPSPKTSYQGTAKPLILSALLYEDPLAVDPFRIQSLSVHDSAGNVLVSASF